MAKQQQYADEADHVVVGSGSSGAAIAGRLAESGASVIVVEAGKSDKQYLTKKSGMIGPMHAVPEIKRRVDWGYYSVPQKHLLDRRIPVPRGKVVGGSSSINGMVYVRGNRANFDSWAAEGNRGWDADTVNAAYRRMEDFEDGANEFRGAGGPIRITRNAFPQEGTHQFIQATSDVLGVKVLDDHNAASQEGVSLMQQNAANGLRHSASRGYLHDLGADLRRGTLQLQSETLTRKVVIENGRATGIEVEDLSERKSGRRTIRAGEEVVLSAGFVGSAQLLMLSGVVGLRVGGLRAHQPGHRRARPPVAPAAVVLRQPQPGRGDPPRRRPAPGADRADNADLPAQPRHPAARRRRPDEHAAHRLPVPRQPGRPRRAHRGHRDGARGDGRRGVRGSGQERDPPRHPAAGQPLRDAILNRATSAYHGVGTCRMGVDELAVVDPELRVRGVEGLRVCDASVMPSITGGNTNAPAIMIGERGADLMLGR